MFCCLFFGNFCCGQPTAAALRSRHHSSAASAWGERRAIQRMQGIRAHPQLAHDHGNIFSGREAAHSATTERSLRINACTGLHCGATPPPIATAKGQPAVQAPQWVLRGPNEGERAAKKLFAIGLVKRKKLPSPPRHEENSACERACVSLRRARSSNAQHRTDFKSKRAQGRSGVCCSRCFCFHRPRTGTLCPSSRCAAAQVPPLLAQHRCHRPQSPAPLTRTTRRSQYLQCITQSRERLFPSLSALSSPLALPPALLLHVHRCARSQLITQQRTAHQPLRVF